MNQFHHLTIRVAWHDSKWNGCMCEHPSENPFCTALDRIREEKDDDAEEKIAGKAFNEIDPSQLPPCQAESGAFMNPEPWFRVLKHPYQDNDKATRTHGHLLPTRFEVPEYSTFAVPFAWMLKNSQQAIQDSMPESLPLDIDAPFPTPWVFGRERQEALLRLFFGKLKEGTSLVFFYTKEGHPLGDSIRRLIVGAGLITKVGKLFRFESSTNEPAYPPWDRIISHSIRPDGTNGVLLPYHEYLQPTGDFQEDERRRELLNEIIVPVDDAHIRDFSYSAEIITPDVTLSALVRLQESLRKIKEHGIIKGPWEEREEWVNQMIDHSWQQRGPFPGLGAALEALGMRLGTSFYWELCASSNFEAEDDPWMVIEKIMSGRQNPPSANYQSEIDVIRSTWQNLNPQRKSLLKLLSRFGLSVDQMKRWFNKSERDRATKVSINDQQIIENPYMIVENDLGSAEEKPITIGVIDRGLLPDVTIRKKYPTPVPSCVDSINDKRRIRAALVSVLQQAALEGDSLLSNKEAFLRLQQLALSRDIMISEDWIETNKDFLNEVIDIFNLQIGKDDLGSIPVVQLQEYKKREKYLRKIFAARSCRSLEPIAINWEKLLVEAIKEAGGSFDKLNSDHIYDFTEKTIGQNSSRLYPRENARTLI